MRSNRLFIPQRSIVKTFDLWHWLRAVVLALLIIYLFYRIIIIFLPPYLEVITPVNQAEVKNFSLEVRGKVSPTADVYLNGERLNNQSGYFQKEVKLLPGLNTLKFSAKKKYSKEKVIYRQVIYTP